ncbi:oxidoreductase domain-containing protein [Candidatus Omnitrophus magneticus]|uniref:Oxidoreductase domain-containing protein n=1 Tax=Candidatus Omnitrophus magneticus TaxID=1609969 RepID=A0A0F0CUQ3_9BACT|nr:oxidoreductase domain-containing protein [Candidatus Omnitrophus magneticus]
MKKLRVGVVGTGHLGFFHVKKYAGIAQAADIVLTSVCDVREEIVKETARKYNVEYYTDYNKMMHSVDAVSIVVPTILHHQIARDFLKADKHVLIEKPLTKTLEEADELLALAKKRNLIIQVGHIERFNSAIRAIEPFLKKPKFIECQRLGSITKKARISDVGVVLDLMIHDIDIILGLVNSKVKNIEAFGASSVSNHEDMANVRLTFQNKVIADITASRLTNEEVRKLRIFQEDSYILMDYMNKEAVLFEKTNNVLGKKQLVIEKKDALEIELLSFIDCVRNNKKPIVSGVEGREALCVALAILEKIKSNPHSNKHFAHKAESFASFGV